jgi:adenine-specific DNA-methyltransferase
MHPGESLLICCRSFSKACEERYPNITVKKIPNMLLGRCEFGKEDYSLNIVNMPSDPDAPEFEPKGPEEKTKKPTPKKAKKDDQQTALFKDE